MSPAPLWYARLRLLMNVAEARIGEDRYGLYLAHAGDLRVIALPADPSCGMAVIRAYTDGAPDDILCPVAAAVAWFVTGDVHFLTEAGVL